MSRFGGIHLPPLGSAVNAAWQNIRQHVPVGRGGHGHLDGDDFQAAPGGGGGGGGFRGSNMPGERVHFAQLSNEYPNQGSMDEHHEMSSFGTSNACTNPFKQAIMADGNEDGSGYQAESSFNIPRQQSTVSSVSDDFVEGKSDIKINEYQAAWNVTNAIQVSMGGRDGCIRT